MSLKFAKVMPVGLSRKGLVLIGLFVAFTITAGVLHVKKLLNKPPLPPPYVPTVFDPRLLRLTPIERAKVPEETEFQSPMGTSQGALVYDAQPFLTLNPTRGGRHTGADLNGIGGWNSDMGEPVRAAGAGLVVFSALVPGGWGQTVILAHRVPGQDGGKILLTMYSHLKARFAPVGLVMERGEKIGEVGTGEDRYLAHLHFEVRDLSVPHPSFGYSGGEGWDTLARLNPDAFLREHAPQGDIRPVPTVSWRNTPLNFTKSPPPGP